MHVCSVALLVLRNQDRGKAAVAVARNLKAWRAFVGQHGLAARAVALVGRVFGAHGASWIAQVMSQFGTQCPLDQCLLEYVPSEWTATPSAPSWVCLAYMLLKLLVMPYTQNL
jgi:hypothetical protein